MVVGLVVAANEAAIKAVIVVTHLQTLAELISALSPMR
jgi:hypothetical protein